LAPLEVLEKGATVAPHARKEELDPIVQPKIGRARQQVEIATFLATMTN
jgi:hypothetical protein